MYASIVKPHYQLLGMLLERRELRSELTNRRLRRADNHSESDPQIFQLAHQLKQLDNEIRAHQTRVWQRFMADGRSLDDLRAFIGDDLLDELAASAH